MSSQGQGVLEGETHGPQYGLHGHEDEAGRPLLNGPVSEEQRRSVSYGAVPGEEVLSTEAQGTGAASGMRDNMHNIHERATHAQNDQQAAAAAAAARTQPSQGPLEVPASAPVSDVLRMAATTTGEVSTNASPRHVTQVTAMGHEQRLQEGRTVESTQGITVQVAGISPPEELPVRGDGAQGSQAVWMVRLGEFFQRRVSQAAATVAPMLDRPVRGRTIVSPPASWMTPASPKARPLFSPEAERAMQQWPQQAPLLHGTENQMTQAAPRDGASSSGSLTQEQVLSEVRRQVQVAMQGHQIEMKMLRNENQRLRDVVENQQRGIEAMEATLQPNLRGGNPAEVPGGHDLRDERHGGYLRAGPPRGPGVPEGNAVTVREASGAVGAPPGLEGEGQDVKGGGRGPQPTHGDGNARTQGQPMTQPEPDSFVQCDERVQKGAGGGMSEPCGLNQMDPGLGNSSSGLHHGSSAGQGQKGLNDPFSMLAQGIAQLQSAMSASLNNRAHEMELVKPGISELPRLPELSETSCIDIGDWIHSLQCPMGDLSNGSSSWWRELLQCLDRFYTAYLESSNLAKLNLKPESFATAFVKEEKWSRVDKRATSMILAALPEAVRAEVLALRLTGSSAVLGRIMVLYRPGSAAERQQILKALESPQTASTPQEAVDLLRRWARWLRRASDVGLRCPDASVLLKGLDVLTRKVLVENAEIQFRLNMMRYTLEIDTKPSQKNVEDFHHALLSEFEQVAFRGRTKGNGSTQPTVRTLTAPTTTASAPSTTSSQEPGQGDSSPGKGRGAPCKFFLTDQGCRRGGQCKYSHDVDRKQRQGRCWTCGSKQHMSKTCPTKDGKNGPKSPTRTTSSTTTRPEATSTTPTVAALAPESSHPVPPAPTSPGTSTAPASQSLAPTTSVAPTNEGDIRELLREANSMLKELRQIRMITVKDVEATAKSLGMEPETGRSGLLDSGASHAYRQGTEEEINGADRVRVQLANGDCVTLAQNRAGTLLATKAAPEDDALPIVPLGSLVQDLNCELTWGRKRGLEIKHPIHGTIRPRVIGKCPLIGETQPLQLIKELEEKRVEELQRSTAAMQRALWMWDQEATWARHLHAFLKGGGRTSQLKALDAEDSPFHALSSTAKGTMAEDLVLDQKAGWNYLKALPVSRRKRKLLMASEWVINLFAGPSDGTAELKVLEDECVMIEIDIVRSKAFDMRKTTGVFRALMWAAAMGRIRGFMASPPLRSEADELLVGKAMWCSLVAKAARGFYEEPPTFVMFEGPKLLDTMRHSEEHKKFEGLQTTWRKFNEVMCLDELYGTVATNLDYEEKMIPTSNRSGRWTEEFKIGTVKAVKKWFRTPETRQRTKWMAKMDTGEFLSSLSTKELEQWKVHVKNNHLPYHRKCRTCVESSGTGRKHVKIKTPSSYCLSLDVCGPFRQRGADPDHTDYRFALIGAYVVPCVNREVPEGGPHNREVPEGGPHNREVPEGGPHSREVPEGGPHSREVPEGGPHSREVPEGGPHSREVPEGGLPEDRNDGKKVQIVGGDFEPEVVSDTGEGLGPLRAWTEGELIEDHEEAPVSPEERCRLPEGMTEEEFQQVFSEVEGIEGYQVMYLSAPLRSRTTRDVLAAVQDIYLRLRSMGYPIVRVHADRARELRCDQLKKWLLSRGTFPRTQRAKLLNPTGARSPRFATARRRSNDYY